MVLNYNINLFLSHISLKESLAWLRKYRQNITHCLIVFTPVILNPKSLVVKSLFITIPKLNSYIEVLGQELQSYRTCQYYTPRNSAPVNLIKKKFKETSFGLPWLLNFNGLWSSIYLWYCGFHCLNNTCFSACMLLKNKEMNK